MSERRRLIRFAAVGTFVALYYVLTYALLAQLLQSRWSANALAFSSAVVIQYVGQTLFTFEKPLAVPAQFGRFLCMIGAGLVLSAIITGIAGPRLGLSDFVSAGVVAVSLPILNFVILRVWVFR